MKASHVYRVGGCCCLWRAPGAGVCHDLCQNPPKALFWHHPEHWKGTDTTCPQGNLRAVPKDIQVAGTTDCSLTKRCPAQLPSDVKEAEGHTSHPVLPKSPHKGTQGFPFPSLHLGRALCGELWLHPSSPCLSPAPLPPAPPQPQHPLPLVLPPCPVPVTQGGLAEERQAPALLSS